MRIRPLLAALSLSLAAAIAPNSAALADAPRGSTLVVARVGDRTITAGELARRLGQVPPFQLRTFGNTQEEVRRNFLERVLVREILLSEGARQRHIEDRPDVADRIRTVMRNEMVAATRARVKVEHPIGPADIKAYYDANASKFHAPARVSVWRIQVGTEKDAREILGEMKKDPQPSTKRWQDLARDRSVDATSRMRGGDLGYIATDGSSSVENVHIDGAALAALAKAKDGALVPEPVQEERVWSVLWRRQSLRAVERPLEIEAVPIRQILGRKHMEDAMQALLTQLRERVTEEHPMEVDLLEVEQNGDLSVMRRPGSLAARKQNTAQPLPRNVGGFLR